MSSKQFPVLIVGAGAAGLSLSLLLQQQGIQPLLIERRAEVSWHPRARNLNFRTLEVFRGLGLAEQIRAAGAPVSRIFARSQLCSPEQKEVMDPGAQLNTRDLSPEPLFWYCPQSRHEPILLAAARKGAAEVRYATELTAFTQDEDGVTAKLRHDPTRESYTVRAQFLVAADGSHSTVRESLGIPCQGIGKLDEHWVFIYLRAPWRQFIRGHDSDAFLIDNPDVHGIFMAAEQDLGMFVLTQGENAGEITRERALQLMRGAFGERDLAIEIIEVSPWQPEQRVAEQFQQGRVFLAGDAAHTMPPKLGLGANSAIQSAQNLAWKLAAVIRGTAALRLLQTYQMERRPVGWFASEASLTGPVDTILDKGRRAKELSIFFPIVGYRYRSPAVIPEHAEEFPNEAIALLDREELTGVPGTRVPHVWLERDSRRISTLDLLDGSFVLLAGSKGGPWCEAARRAGATSGVGMSVYRVGPQGDLLDPGRNWIRKAGVAEDGAMLLRPDGFVAWRARKLAQRPERLLKLILHRVLGQSTAIAVEEFS